MEQTNHQRRWLLPQTNRELQKSTEPQILDCAHLEKEILQNTLIVPGLVGSTHSLSSDFPSLKKRLGGFLFNISTFTNVYAQYMNAITKTNPNRNPYRI